MKLEKIEDVKAFLASWLDYWVLQSIAFTILILQENEPYNFWLWAMLSFYPFCLYLIRRKFRDLGRFAGCHLTLIIVFMLLPTAGIMEKIFFMLYVAGYAVYSLYIRMSTVKWQDRAMPPLIAGGILTVLVFVLYYFNRHEMENLFVLFCVIYLVLYFTYSYMLEYIHFVKMNEGSAGYIPVRKMFAAGLKSVLPYSVISGILLLVLGNASLITTVFKWIKNALLWFLRMLFAGTGDNGNYDNVQGNESLSQQLGASMPKMEGEAFWLWELLEKVMAVGIILLAVVVAIKVYKMLSLALQKIFSRSIQKNGEVKEELVDMREKCKVESARKEQDRKHVLSIFSTKERIRKIYKKKIENARKTSGYRNFLKEEKTVDVCTLDSGTARECCISLSAEPLADIYDKARYSDMECSGEDLQNAKKWQ